MKLKVYLKERSNIIWIWIGNIFIFVAVLMLYHVTLKAIIYPALLSFAVLYIYISWDLYQTKEKIRLLEDMVSGINDSFPEVRTREEQIYQNYIQKLKQEEVGLIDQQEIRYKDMIDYYTTWAHQIKTPIAAMRLKLQNEDTLLSRQLNSDLLRTEQYVDMVMVYLRLDSPSTDYVLRNCSIDDMVRKTVSTFATEFISRGLTLKMDPLKGSLVTDEKWFCFVLEQLISNALKYTKKGEIRISMENHILTIADTGIGIAAQDLPRIFQKGYTGFNGRRDRHASGLGLYLCKQICDRLNIAISVESEVNKGSQFSLNLSQYELKTE